MAKPRTGTEIAARSEVWRERIAEQEGSGISVKRFCAEHGLTEQSFYGWRKRLRQQPPVRFALVETPGTGRTTAEPILELVLATGDRLRISTGVDATALRTVLEALRA